MLLHIVTKLHVLFIEVLPDDSLNKKLSIKIVDAMFRWSTCEGIPGLKRAKTMSNVLVRHLMGTPIEQVILSSKYKRFIECALSLCTCTRSKIYWISIFSAFRLIVKEPEIDASTITSRFKGNLIGLLKIKYFKAFSQVKKSFLNSVPPIIDWECQFK